jgi:hypothetical protein
LKLQLASSAKFFGRLFVPSDLETDYNFVFFWLYVAGNKTRPSPYSELEINSKIKAISVSAE